MEERSSKRPRPSGDWKPYRREEEGEQAPESGDSPASSKPNGDWKPYDRPQEAEAAEAREEPKARQESREEPRSEAEDRSQQDDSRDESRDRQGEHEPSGVDAMGQDKHRKVSGQRYGLSRGRQVLYYGLFVVFIIAAYIGLKAGADALDKPPAHDADKAPWSKSGAKGEPLGGFTPTSPGQKGATDFQ